MKIQINSLRSFQRASGLLLFVVVTFVLFVGGMGIYNLLKWAKRVDNGQVIPRPGFTNDESIVIPPNEPSSSITGAQFRDPQIWFEWVEYEDPITALQPPLALFSRPSPVTNAVITMLPQGAELRLQIALEVSTPNEITFADLGVPVDEYGMPNDLSWRTGTIPSGIPQTWVLERSSNAVDWEFVSQQQIFPTVPARCYDRRVRSMFYRAVRVP